MKKMVIKDLISQRNYNYHNKSLSSSSSFVSPQQNNISQIEELKNKRILSEPTITNTTSSSSATKYSLTNSAKICSKTSRKNLKRL